MIMKTSLWQTLMNCNLPLLLLDINDWVIYVWLPGVIFLAVVSSLVSWILKIHHIQNHACSVKMGRRKYNDTLRHAKWHFLRNNHGLHNRKIYFPKIHRSVLSKITINLFYFWEIYDVNLWEKNFGRSTVYSCKTNVFI